MSTCCCFDTLTGCTTAVAACARCPPCLRFAAAALERGRNGGTMYLRCLCSVSSSGEQKYVMLLSSNTPINVIRFVPNST